MRSLAFLALILTAAPAIAEDWPQWLGPRRDASSTEKVAPWKEAPRVLWRREVGEAHSSPVVAGGKVYVFTKVKDKEEEELAAYDASDGKELWKSAYARAKFASPFGKGPQATPAVHDGRAFTFGATGVLTAFDAATGEKLWQVDTLKQFGGKNLFFGAACSPLVEDGRVFVNISDTEASVVAFSADRGKVVWKTLGGPPSYSSPIALGNKGQRQVVFFTGKGLASLSRSDGEVFWKFPLVDKLMESSTTPVHVGDRLLASSITYGTIALALSETDGKPTANEDWKNPALTSYFTTPVMVGEDLYMVTGSNPLTFKKAQAVLHCVNLKTGKSRWSKPGVGEYHAALIRTGDDKLLLMQENGTLVLVDPSPKEYRELARAKVCGHAWAHPAIANGRFYVRDEKELVCVGLGE